MTLGERARPVGRLLDQSTNANIDVTTRLQKLTQLQLGPSPVLVNDANALRQSTATIKSFSAFSAGDSRVAGTARARRRMNAAASDGVLMTTYDGSHQAVSPHKFKKMYNPKTHVHPRARITQIVRDSGTERARAAKQLLKDKRLLQRYTTASTSELNSDTRHTTALPPPPSSSSSSSSSDAHATTSSSLTALLNSDSLNMQLRRSVAELLTTKEQRDTLVRRFETYGNELEKVS
jgi:hypothetical protein